MIKNILLGIDTSEHSRSAQAYGFMLARRFGAALTALHVIDIVSIEGPFFHDISGSLGLEPYLDFSSKMREVLTTRGETILGEFSRAAAQEGIRAETVLDVGIVADQICERAKSADLLIIGHRGVNERLSPGLLGSTTESVARKCPRPVLIAPRRFSEIRHPVLAYDGSERASRAMQAAAEFASAMDLPLTVIAVARDPKLGERVIEQARAYFRASWERTEFKVLSGHAHEEIIKFLAESGGDLLFLGAYGHSRIIEMVIGSTTEYLLRNASCPVFICR